MVTVLGTYHDGNITLDKQFDSPKPVKVSVTFLEEVTIKNGKRLSLTDFSFFKSREILKDYKGSLSDAVIEERRGDGL